MNYEELGDNELIYMVQEENEEAKDYLYEKYRYIIDIIVKKYMPIANILGYEYKELLQDALLGLSYAISNYRDDKKTSFATFATLCIDRRLQYAIRSINNKKTRINNESLSLEYEYEEGKSPLKDIISDDYEHDPLNMAINSEGYDWLIRSIKNKLSNFEYEVFQYMLDGLSYTDIAKKTNREAKNIDNTIQRVRKKIKDIINNRY